MIGRIFTLFLFFVLLLVVPAITSAECLKDQDGEVYCGAGQCRAMSNGTIRCSRYYDGSAEYTSSGQVLCGKGQCVKLSNGSLFCSTEVGGAVLFDSNGNARCYGQCEPATVEMCETTRAGSS
jgi:hypothetical protein